MMDLFLLAKFLLLLLCMLQCLRLIIMKEFTASVC